MEPEAEDFWTYEGSPTDFDLVNNNLFSVTIRFLLHLLLRIYLRLFHRITYHNREILRKATGMIVAANHSSHLDAVILFSAFPLGRIHQIRSLAARDYFFKNPWIRTAGFLMANTVPLERGRISTESFAFCKAKIQKGCNIVFFPEGTRSPDGRMGAFKPGLGLFALECGAPVVPVRIRGAHEAFPKGSFFPRPRKIEVHIGTPRDFLGWDNTKDNWIRLTEVIQRDVESLPGPPV